VTAAPAAHHRRRSKPERWHIAGVLEWESEEGEEERRWPSPRTRCRRLSELSSIAVWAPAVRWSSMTPSANPSPSLTRRALPPSRAGGP